MTLSLRCEGMVADLLAEGYALAGARLAILSQLPVVTPVSSLRAKKILSSSSDEKQFTCNVVSNENYFPRSHNRHKQ